VLSFYKINPANIFSFTQTQQSFITRICYVYLPSESIATPSGLLSILSPSFCMSSPENGSQCKLVVESNLFLKTFVHYARSVQQPISCLQSPLLRVTGRKLPSELKITILLKHGRWAIGLPLSTTTKLPFILKIHPARITELNLPALQRRFRFSKRFDQFIAFCH
jgi:hypothetical protein